MATSRLMGLSIQWRVYLLSKALLRLSHLVSSKCFGQCSLVKFYHHLIVNLTVQVASSITSNGAHNVQPTTNLSATSVSLIAGKMSG